MFNQTKYSARLERVVQALQEMIDTGSFAIDKHEDPFVKDAVEAALTKVSADDEYTVYDVIRWRHGALTARDCTKDEEEIDND